MTKRNILIVDDEESILEFFQDFLECYGYSVTTCLDASKALNMIHSDSNKFDLLITDQTMPDMTGMELIKKVREVIHSIPVILLSGYNNEYEINENDAMLFLQKPIDNFELLKNIEVFFSK